jgi:hypothetical protein
MADLTRVHVTFDKNVSFRNFNLNDLFNATDLFGSSAVAMALHMDKLEVRLGKESTINVGDNVVLKSNTFRANFANSVLYNREFVTVAVTADVALLAITAMLDVADSVDSCGNLVIGVMAS